MENVTMDNENTVENAVYNSETNGFKNFFKNNAQVGVTAAATIISACAAALIGVMASNAQQQRNYEIAYAPEESEEYYRQKAIKKYEKKLIPWYKRPFVSFKKKKEEKKEEVSFDENADE